MAREVNYTAADELFIGTDFELAFQAWDDEDPDNPVPMDVTGMDLIFTVRKTDVATGAPLLEKTSGEGITLEGTFNIDPLTNTQVIVITFEDTDTAAADGSAVLVRPAPSAVLPNPYRHSLKRQDDGFETILAYGDFTLLEATNR